MELVPYEETGLVEAPVQTVAEDSWQSSRKALQTTHLEYVRDQLRRQRLAQNPEDINRQAGQFMVGFRGTTPLGFFMSQDGTPGPMWKLDRRALRSLCSFYLPNRGLGFMDALAKLEKGDKTATMVMSQFRETYEKNHLFRTVLGVDGHRQVRAVLSNNYPVYDNLQFIEDVMNGLGNRVDEWKVLDYSNRDSRMRVRMLHENDEYRARQIDKPIPTISLHNGEVGNSAVRILPGTFTLWCSNGCGNHLPLREQGYAQNHSGKTAENIQENIGHALESTLVTSYGIVKQYNQAMHVQIDEAFGENPAFAWFQDQVADNDLVSDKIQEQVRHTMENERTVHGRNLLTTVVDAVTYVAHEQMDLAAQDRLERLGGELLHSGLGQSQHRRIFRAE